MGLYLNPPENALVLCIDEKPSIQALERAQGWLRLPNGKAMNGFSHGYKRHGTTTLFAAFDIATGQVIAGHYSRRRRREFLDFMNEIVAAYPDRDLHVVLDNLNTHKPKNDRWLKSHQRVHLHFTPTYSSWLNRGMLVQHPQPAGAGGSKLYLTAATAESHRQVRQSLQQNRRALRVEEGGGPSCGGHKRNTLIYAIRH